MVITWVTGVGRLIFHAYSPLTKLSKLFERPSWERVSFSNQMPSTGNINYANNCPGHYMVTWGLIILKFE